MTLEGEDRRFDRIGGERQLEDMEGLCLHHDCDTCGRFLKPEDNLKHKREKERSSCRFGSPVGSLGGTNPSLELRHTAVSSTPSTDSVRTLLKVKRSRENGPPDLSSVADNDGGPNGLGCRLAERWRPLSTSMDFGRHVIAYGHEDRRDASVGSTAEDDDDGRGRGKDGSIYGRGQHKVSRLVSGAR